MKSLYVLVFICLSIQLPAQTFLNNTGGQIQEVGIENLYPLSVTGLQSSIDTPSFGVISVCFNIIHPYDADLDISLRAPDGTTVMLSNNNGFDGDNFTGTCVMENAINGEISAMNAPFTGNYYPDASLNKVNNGQNPNGTWHLVIVDEAPLDTGLLVNWSLTFDNNLPSTHEGGPCTTTNAIGCDCADAGNECDLLPDMINSSWYIHNNWTEYNGYLTLGVATPNIGYGPLEMHGTGECYCDTQLVNCNSTCPDGSGPKENVVQTIYHKSGAVMSSYQIPAGTMTYHPQHQHIHVDNWTFNTLRIRGNDPNPTTWPIIGTGSKISFCLINLGTCFTSNGNCIDDNGNVLDVGSMPNGGLGSVSGCDYDQGIFVGKYDAYDEYLDGQEIDFGSICNGQYYIVSQTDPFNEVKEMSDSNNWSSLLVDLIHQNGACCTGAFHADTTTGVAPFEVQFIDSTVPIAQSWQWDFGDGNYSSDQFPKHVYLQAGVYTVKLFVVTSLGCTDTITRTGYITVAIGTGIPSLDEPLDIDLRAFPNPATTSADIAFELKHAAYFQLVVTDLSGNVLRTIYEGIHPSGKYQYNLAMDKGKWPAGVYIVRAISGKKQSQVKVMKM